MDSNRDKQLEALIQQELSKLPELKAPETLVPGVLAALERRARAPWWQRPWHSWPVGCQIASIPVGIGCAILLGMALVLALDFAHSQPWIQRVREELLGVPQLCLRLSAWATLLVQSTLALGKPWLVTGTILTLAMYLATVAIGAVWLRVAFPKR